MSPPGRAAAAAGPASPPRPSGRPACWPCSPPAARRAPATRPPQPPRAGPPEAAAGTGGAGSAPGSARACSPRRWLRPAQAIVYTASLTVRATDISRVTALAEGIAAAAGGYVSSENTLLDRAHPAQSTVNLQLKIPVAAYPATLAELSTRLGTRISVSQQAQDVTQTVADVTSRVASAQAAITQLRALLGRAWLGRRPAHRPEPDRPGRVGPRIASVPAAGAQSRDQLCDSHAHPGE